MTNKQQAIIWANEVLKKNDVVLLDTETTGVDKKARLIDLGVINSKGSTVIDLLINPNMPIPERASEVNHIYDDMVKNSPKFEQIYSRVFDLLDGKTILAWNSNFDKRIVENEFKILDKSPPNCKWIDVMPIYGKYSNKGHFNKLCLAAQECGIIQEQTHRSVDDCIFTLKVIQRMALG